MIDIDKIKVDCTKEKKIWYCNVKVIQLSNNFVSKSIDKQGVAK